MSRAILGTCELCMSSPLKIESIMNFKIDRNIAGCCLKLRMPMTPNVLQNALETELCLRLTFGALRRCFCRYQMTNFFAAKTMERPL
jgi:hypothetical protein